MKSIVKIVNEVVTTISRCPQYDKDDINAMELDAFDPEICNDNSDALDPQTYIRFWKIAEFWHCVEVRHNANNVPITIVSMFQLPTPLLPPLDLRPSIKPGGSLATRTQTLPCRWQSHSRAFLPLTLTMELNSFQVQQHTQTDNYLLAPLQLLFEASQSNCNLW